MVEFCNWWKVCGKSTLFLSVFKESHIKRLPARGEVENNSGVGQVAKYVLVWFMVWWCLNCCGSGCCKVISMFFSCLVVGLSCFPCPGGCFSSPGTLGLRIWFYWKLCGVFPPVSVGFHWQCIVCYHCRYLFIPMALVCQWKTSLSYGLQILLLFLL